MRKSAIIIIAVLFVIIISPYPKILNFQNANAQISGEYLRLYAHSRYGSRPFGNNILSTAPPYGILKSSILDEGISFNLYPPLTSNLSVSGTLNCRLWLKSDIPEIIGINISLYEVKSENTSLSVSGAIMNIPAKKSLSEFVFGIPINHNFSKDSTIGLFIKKLESNNSLTLFWDDRSAPTMIALPIASHIYFNEILIKCLDSQNSSLSYANVTILRDDLKYWTGFTDSTGFLVALLPFTEVDQVYEIKTYWKNTLVNSTSIDVNKTALIQLRCDVYNLNIQILDLFSQPMNSTTVNLLNNSETILERRTDSNGTVIFNQQPSGNYTVTINYIIKFLIFSIRNYEDNEISLAGNETKIFKTNYAPESFLNLIAMFLVLMPILFFGILRVKRKSRIYKIPFDYFNTLVNGGIPSSNAIMIVGNPGSGKTVLLEHLMDSSMTEGRPSVFITNLDFPSKIKESLNEFGFKNDFNDDKKIKFIDCYSETAGKKSEEKYSISSIGDLTTLGIKISSCLEELGKGTDIFFDSLTPLFPILKSDFIINFVHAMSAKIKGIEGRFYFTISTGIEKEILAKLESASDCVIETQVFEEKEYYKRKLRLKKLRKKHIEKWIDFTIEDKKGIIFLLQKKPRKEKN